MHINRNWNSRLLASRTVGLGFVAGLVLLTQGQQAQADDYSDGKTLFQSKQYGPAAAKLLKAVKSAPTHAAETYYMLGCCYYKQNRPNEAKALFRTVATNFAASPEARLAGIMLARLEPKSAGGGVPARTAAVGIQNVQSMQSADDPELASLPDQNNIYFKSAGSGHMQVTAYLDGRAIECWFDTGASAHFGKNHLSAAGIPTPNGRPNGQTSGWSGNAVPVWRQTSSLRLGGMTRKVPITVEEDMQLMPLVGQEFIRGYQYEIENSRDGGGIIRMKKTQKNSGSSKNFSALYDVPCTTQNARDYVVMEVEGKKLTVLLDTGAATSMFHPDDLKKLGVRVDEDAPLASMVGVGGGLSVRVVPLRLRLGPIDKTMSVNVGGSAGSAVGQDFLGSARFTIDRENKLLRFFH